MQSNNGLSGSVTLVAAAIILLVLGSIIDNDLFRMFLLFVAALIVGKSLFNKR